MKSHNVHSAHLHLLVVTQVTGSLGFSITSASLHIQVCSFWVINELNFKNTRGENSGGRQAFDLIKMLLGSHTHVRVLGCEARLGFQLQLPASGTSLGAASTVAGYWFAEASLGDSDGVLGSWLQSDPASILRCCGPWGIKQWMSNLHFHPSPAFQVYKLIHLCIEVCRLELLKILIYVDDYKVRMTGRE